MYVEKFISINKWMKMSFSMSHESLTNRFVEIRSAIIGMCENNMIFNDVSRQDLSPFIIFPYLEKCF